MSLASCLSPIVRRICGSGGGGSSNLNADIDDSEKRASDRVGPTSSSTATTGTTSNSNTSNTTSKDSVASNGITNADTGNAAREVYSALLSSTSAGGGGPGYKSGRVSMTSEMSATIPPDSDLGSPTRGRVGSIPDSVKSNANGGDKRKDSNTTDGGNANGNANSETIRNANGNDAVRNTSENEINLFRHHEAVLFDKGKRTRVLPVVVLTGFLGAGKTTLVKKILDSKLNLRIATCVHEAADVNIDSHLLSEVARDGRNENRSEQDSGLLFMDKSGGGNPNNKSNKSNILKFSNGKMSSYAGGLSKKPNNNAGAGGKPNNNLSFDQIFKTGWVVPLHGGCGCTLGEALSAKNNPSSLKGLRLPDATTHAGNTSTTNSNTTNPANTNSANSASESSISLESLALSNTDTYKKSLRQTLKIFLEEGIDEGLIDYCIIETSGAEDPQSLCEQLGLAFGPEYRARLDCVVCVVDATTIEEIEEVGEVDDSGKGSDDGGKGSSTSKRRAYAKRRRELIRKQLDYSDLLVINKLDLKLQDDLFCAPVAVNVGGIALPGLASPAEDPDDLEQSEAQEVSKILKLLGWESESDDIDLPYMVSGPNMQKIGIGRILNVHIAGSTDQLSHEQSASFVVSNPFMEEETGDSGGGKNANSHTGMRKLRKRDKGNASKLPAIAENSVSSASVSGKGQPQVPDSSSDPLSRTLALQHLPTPAVTHPYQFLRFMNTMARKFGSSLWRGKAVVWVEGWGDHEMLKQLKKMLVEGESVGNIDNSDSGVVVDVKGITTSSGFHIPIISATMAPNSKLANSNSEKKRKNPSQKFSQKWLWSLSGNYRVSLDVAEWEAGIQPYTKIALIGDPGVHDVAVRMEEDAEKAANTESSTTKPKESKELASSDWCPSWCQELVNKSYGDPKSSKSGSTDGNTDPDADFLSLFAEVFGYDHGNSKNRIDEISSTRNTNDDSNLLFWCCELTGSDKSDEEKGNDTRVLGFRFKIHEWFNRDELGINAEKSNSTSREEKLNEEKLKSKSADKGSGDSGPPKKLYNSEAAFLRAVRKPPEFLDRLHHEVAARYNRRSGGRSAVLGFAGFLVMDTTSATQLSTSSLTGDSEVEVLKFLKRDLVLLKEEFRQTLKYELRHELDSCLCG